MISIQLNGNPHQLPPSSSISQLIEQLGHSGKRIAVERNGDIVPRSLHPQTLLQDGDKIEIVVAVGGG